MTIDRANLFYFIKSPNVSGTGIDIRYLYNIHLGSNDVTTTATAVHTDDNTERTFDPLTAVGATVADSLTLQRKGWALHLADDMTPADDTNCNAMLNAGTLEVKFNASLSWAGATAPAVGATALTWRVSLWRYKHSDTSGTSIASDSATNVNWDVTAITGDPSGTIKQVTIPIVLASDVEFLAGEIFLIQVGVNTGALPNALVGTQTYTFALQVDSASTFVDFAADQSIHLLCRLTGDTVGKGTVAAPVRAAELARSAVGKGFSTMARVATISKSFDLVGKGVATRQFLVSRPFSLVGKGEATMTRVVVAAKSFTAEGRGTATRSSHALAMSRTVIGTGTASATKATTAAKSFSLVGTGTPTFARVAQIFRTRSLVGKGSLSGSRIEIPIDEVPEGGGGTTIIKKILFIFDD